MTHPAHRQTAYPVRFDWGLAGARAAEAGTDLAVVVDVLSFTTAVSVAVARGIAVLPYPWRDTTAGEYAAARDAVLAVGRREARESGVISLSPASLLTGPAPARVVLPSPNGSTISAALAETSSTVVASSLRNRLAVARWLVPRVAEGASVVVVAAGEHWPDGALRPAVEDLWGAGAVLAALVDAGVSGLSPEARVAEHAWRAVAPRLPAELAACASAGELVEAGFARDVTLAADLDVTPVVPLLCDGAFLVAPA